MFFKKFFKLKFIEGDVNKYINKNFMINFIKVEWIGR